MRILLPLLTVILFFSCSSESVVPKGILQPKKMQLVFWDYMRADVYTRDFIFVKKDSTLKDTTENTRLQNRIFSYYNITREDFYRSYDYYANHPQLMTNLMDSIIAKRTKKQIEVKGKINPKQTSL